MPKENFDKNFTQNESAPDKKVEDILDNVEKVPENSVFQVGGQSIQTNRKEPEFKKRIDLFKIIRIIIVVIIIVVIIFGAWYFLFKIRPIFQKRQTKIQELKGASPTTTSGVILKQKVLDSDHDGLTDVEEEKIGTDKYSVDTDKDGLFDREEVKIYLTNPLNPDTDGDGILDGEEVKRGSDPKDPNPDAKLLDLQKEIKKIK